MKKLSRITPERRAFLLGSIFGTYLPLILISGFSLNLPLFFFNLAVVVLLFRIDLTILCRPISRSRYQVKVTNFPGWAAQGYSASERKSCSCQKCVQEEAAAAGSPAQLRRMPVCPKCGNKRCPGASDHALDCTGTNEPQGPGGPSPQLPRFLFPR